MRVRGIFLPNLDFCHLSKHCNTSSSSSKNYGINKHRYHLLSTYTKYRKTVHVSSYYTDGG